MIVVVDTCGYRERLTRRRSEHWLNDWPIRDCQGGPPSIDCSQVLGAIQGVRRGHENQRGVVLSHGNEDLPDDHWDGGPPLVFLISSS
jgi:hypothetical protein